MMGAGRPFKVTYFAASRRGSPFGIGVAMDLGQNSKRRRGEYMKQFGFAGEIPQKAC